MPWTARAGLELAYIADSGWRAWYKPLRFLWPSFCWYLVYSAVMYVLMLGSYVTALPSEVQSCMPAMILTWALENRVFLYLPVVVALAVGQVVFGLYFGWRSMDDSLDKVALVSACRVRYLCERNGASTCITA